MPRYSVKHVTGSRKIAISAFEGDDIRIDVELQNNTRRVSYMLEVIDSVPAAEKDFRTPMTFVEKLRGREKKKYSYTVSCWKRGEYAVGPLKVVSSYPLGIASAEKELQKERIPLIVYPTLFDIGRLHFLRGNSASENCLEWGLLCFPSPRETISQRYSDGEENTIPSGLRRNLLPSRDRGPFGYN